MTDKKQIGGKATQAESSLEALQQKEQLALAGELALEVMHDIRNPLETLGYLTYLAAQEATDEQKVRLYMDMAEEELDRMRAIAQHTLGLARASAMAAPVDLVDLAETAVRIHQRALQHKGIELKRRLPTEMVVRAQHGPLLQVLSNLIVNALEAMDEAGSLQLRIRKRGNEVDLVVADNGHGIAEEHLARIGERGFTTKDAGNGFGLALSKRIVEQHRGRMRVRSCARPGRHGTVFRVTLPVGEIEGQGGAAAKVS